MGTFFISAYGNVSKRFKIQKGVKKTRKLKNWHIWYVTLSIKMFNWYLALGYKDMGYRRIYNLLFRAKKVIS